MQLLHCMQLQAKAALQCIQCMQSDGRFAQMVYPLNFSCRLQLLAAYSGVRHTCYLTAFSNPVNSLLLTALPYLKSLLCVLWLWPAGFGVYPSEAACCAPQGPAPLASAPGAFPEGCGNVTKAAQPCWVADTYWPTRQCRQSRTLCAQGG
jgi:hypothetical protein